MPIEVYCPNGHKLICPKDFTGTNVKCPRCGVLTEVTARAASRSGFMRGVKMPDSDDAISSGSNMDLHESPTIMQKVPEDHGERFSFACPNGHKLKGPVSLRGRMGQCPHCDTQFQIPAEESPSGLGILGAGSSSSLPSFQGGSTEETTSQPRASLSGLALAGGSDSGQAVKLEAAEATSKAAFLIGEGASAPLSMSESSSTGFSRWEENSTNAPPAHPMASIFQMLWEERDHGGVVELHLKGGTVLTPDWWAPNFSNAGYGLFAIENRDNAYEIETIAWENIVRVSVTNLTELPGGLFE